MVLLRNLYAKDIKKDTKFVTKAALSTACYYYGRSTVKMMFNLQNLLLLKALQSTTTIISYYMNH